MRKLILIVGMTTLLLAGAFLLSSEIRRRSLPEMPTEVLALFSDVAEAYKETELAMYKLANAEEYGANRLRFLDEFGNLRTALRNMEISKHKDVVFRDSKELVDHFKERTSQFMVNLTEYASNNPDLDVWVEVEQYCKEIAGDAEKVSGWRKN